MSWKRFFILVEVAVLLFLVLCVGQPLSFSQEIIPPENDSLPEEQGQEKIVPGAENIKVQTGLYVFVGWLWVSVAVLVFFLRFKIKEADRLYQIKFFRDEEK